MFSVLWAQGRCSGTGYCQTSVVPMISETDSLSLFQPRSPKAMDLAALEFVATAKSDVNLSQSHIVSQKA